MKHTLLAILFLLMGLVAVCQKGTVKESLEFSSTTLGYPVEYSVYIPGDYQTSLRSYPVLYLLHGYSDDETGWVQFGEANTIADKGVENSDFPASIIVIPDGKVTWYCNDYKGDNSWQKMFVEEFIPYIEKTYRIRAKKEFRAIAGLSMGGFYIDCGDDDFLYKGNSQLHIQMRDLGITHEYRVRQGGHEWPYWRTGLYDGLKYMGEKFRR